MTTSRIILAAAAAATLALSACSPPNENPSTETVTSSAASQSEQTLTLSDGVVREKGADSDMTAVFGVITNDSDADIEITGFSTSLDAPMNQLHQTVDGTMSEMTEPLIIPAGQSHTFGPGGDHFMIMGYEPELLAGDVVDLTLDLSDGTEVGFPDVPVRTMGAGHESYGEDGEMTGHDS